MGPEPDIFVRILNKVERIDHIEGQLRGISADVHELKRDVVEIKGVLREHTRILNEHTKILNGHTLRLDQLDTAVIEVHQDVKHHSREITALKSR